MVYFFHHYELPVILQQAHFQQFLLRNSQQQQVQQPNPRPQPAAVVVPPIRATVTQPIRAAVAQLISAVRPEAQTQTSSTAVVSQATSTTGTVTTSTVGTSTSAQPVSSSRSCQTVPASIETTESQTSGSRPLVVASSQTNGETSTRHPSGGSDSHP